MTVGRLGTFVPRLAALTVVWLLATAALTYAAAQKTPSAATPTTTAATTTAAGTAMLTVPDVRRQAFTFAKGSLSDAGFAWKVAGNVRGYASNTVVAQTPAPGTQVVDTGAPTIVLTLAKSGSQLGVPEQLSSIHGTAVKVAGLASAELRATHVARKAAPKKAKVAKKTLAKKKAVAKRAPVRRPAAFVVRGARREPLNELPLTTRADSLLAWLSGHPAATDANVRRWLFQHAWIVAGARMGWWHGDAALETLIKADDRVWQIWGIGARSERIAKQALAAVEARQR